MTEPVAVDLNADVGEGFGHWELGDDETLLGLISSANVACGFHAGDPLVLTRTVNRAAELGVVVGAQVGYRDLAGFGRRFIDMDPEELTAEAIYQMGALDGLCRAAGTQVRYMKPHGALYNTVVDNQPQAEALVAAVLAYDATLPVVGLPGSVFLQAAELAGLATIHEAFADRAYTRVGRLVPRREPGAVLHDPAAVAERVRRLVVDGEIVTSDGTVILAHADSICLHGDSPGAVELARAVRLRLDQVGVTIRPFVTRS